MRISGLKFSVAMSVTLAFASASHLSAQTYGGTSSFVDTGGPAQIEGGTGPSAFSKYSSEVPGFTRAAAAIKVQKYSEAAFALQDIAPHTANPNTAFLAGLANAGVGRLPTARRYFRQAGNLGYSLVDSEVALAIGNLHLDDRRSAESRLKHLERRQSLCEARCSNATDIDQAVIAVRRVLAAS